MPIIRKIIEVGKTSKAVIIPKSWLEFYEKQEGQAIKSVAIEVNRVLKIEPILSKQQEPEKQANRNNPEKEETEP